MRGTGRQSYPAIKNGRSFIWPKIPFVGYFDSHIKPFVCNKRPFVSFNHFFGFTLIELVAALAVVAILVTIVVPNMRGFIQEQRMRTQLNDFLSDFYLVRNEAIRRKTPVTICKTRDSNTCNATESDPWSPGRLIFVDLNRDGVRGGGEEILRVREVLAGQNLLRGTGGAATGTVNRITFESNGMTTLNIADSLTNAAGVRTGDFQMFLCDQRGANQARTIVIHMAGRIRTTASGVNALGNPITAADCS
jgi:type IV fimbrial biogenesis protein FimT